MKLFLNQARFLNGMVSLIVVIGLFGMSSGQAAECKGMSQAKCDMASACSWVKPYTTKAGTKVSGYCRKKPSKSGAKKASAPKNLKPKKKTDSTSSAVATENKKKQATADKKKKKDTKTKKTDKKKSKADKTDKNNTSKKKTEKKKDKKAN